MSVSALVAFENTFLFLTHVCLGSGCYIFARGFAVVYIGYVGKRLIMKKKRIMFSWSLLKWLDVH